jgi:uncharacterized sulfatase
MEIMKNDDGSESEVRQPAYFDIDGSPTKEYIRLNKIEFPEYFQLGFAKRPAEELFDIKNDPGCLQNLAFSNNYEEIRKNLSDQLKAVLTSEEDPRMVGIGAIFDSYPRVSPMRNFPGFKEQSTYNSEFMETNQPTF